MKVIQLPHRPRRNRRHSHIRDLVAETNLKLSQLVYPIFVTEEKGTKQEISSMPGIFRLGPDLAIQHICEAQLLGIHSFALFPVVQEKDKDSNASRAIDPNFFYIDTLKRIKDECSDAILFTDIALDPFSSDGHDGLVRDGKILNDETVDVLVQMAVLHATQGVDYVAPSDMMDGRVGAIRQALDRHGFEETGIMAYSAKYASSFYGPFRDALDSAPRSGDKKTYQMDFRNAREALREVDLDIAEGADIVMIKPALSYLDIICRVRSHVHVPVAAYNVSGEYSMVKFAAKAGFADEKKMIFEILLSIIRAGANMIFTYSALDVARWWNEEDRIK